MFALNVQPFSGLVWKLKLWLVVGALVRSRARIHRKGSVARKPYLRWLAGWLAFEVFIFSEVVKCVLKFNEKVIVPLFSANKCNILQIKQL